MRHSLQMRVGIHSKLIKSPCYEVSLDVVCDPEVRTLCFPRLPLELRGPRNSLRILGIMIQPASADWLFFSLLVVIGHVGSSKYQKHIHTSNVNHLNENLGPFEITLMHELKSF
jgi:hypothetical protein